MNEQEIEVEVYGFQLQRESMQHRGTSNLIIKKWEGCHRGGDNIEMLALTAGYHRSSIVFRDQEVALGGSKNMTGKSTYL